jgi:hypothetical protein
MKLLNLAGAALQISIIILLWYTAKKLVRLGLKTAAVLRLFKDVFKPEVLIFRPWWRSECPKREKLALVLKVKTFLWYSVRPGW